MTKGYWKMTSGSRGGCRCSAQNEMTRFAPAEKTRRKTAPRCCREQLSDPRDERRRYRERALDARDCILILHLDTHNITSQLWLLRHGARWRELDGLCSFQLAKERHRGGKTCPGSVSLTNGCHGRRVSWPFFRVRELFVAASLRADRQGRCLRRPSQGRTWACGHRSGRVAAMGSREAVSEKVVRGLVMGRNSCA